MDPVVVTATRVSTLGLSEMEMLIGSAIVIALLAWAVLTHVRRDQQRPHA